MKQLLENHDRRAERERIAEGLHDAVGQQLAVAQMKLASLSVALADPAQRQWALDAQALVGSAIRCIRTLVFELSPPDPSELGLVEWVRAMAVDAWRHHGLEVQVADDGRDKDLPPETLAPVHGALREIIHNIVKHARARRVRIVLSAEGEQVIVLVEDDGVGISSAAAHGFGLTSTRRRLVSVGGLLAVEPAPGGGTRAWLRVPRQRVLAGIV